MDSMLQVTASTYGPENREDTVEDRNVEAEDEFRAPAGNSYLVRVQGEHYIELFDSTHEETQHTRPATDPCHTRVHGRRRAHRQLRPWRPSRLRHRTLPVRLCS